MAQKESVLWMDNGMKIPVIGLGTMETKGCDMKDAVVEAIKAGYRYIDCAYYYGNENKVGEALKEVIESGLVTRDDLFIVSKLPCNKMDAAVVEDTAKESLKALKLDYLDLYLIHWPVAFKDGPEGMPQDENGKFLFSTSSHFTKTWKGMEAAVDSGLVRSIGVSNFNSRQIRTLLELKDLKYKPAMNQIEIHPYFQNERLLRYCKEMGIAVTGYSCVGAPYPDTSWTEKNRKILMDDKTIKDLAEAIHKTPAQVVLRWAIQRGYVVLVKSKTPARIRSNFQVFDFELTPEQMNLIQTLDDENGRIFRFRDCLDHPEHPFKEEF